MIFDDIANILNLPRVLYSLIWGNFRHLTGNFDQLIVNLASIFKTKYLLVFWTYHEIAYLLSLNLFLTLFSVSSYERIHVLQLSALWIPDAIRILNTNLISVHVHQDLLKRGVKQVRAMCWAQLMAESYFPLIHWFQKECSY